MTAQKIGLPEKKIAELCRRYQVRELAVFGSFARGDFRPDSDIDLLVEFVPEAEVGFLTLARMGRELGEILRRQVDLVPKGDLSQGSGKRFLKAARCSMRREELYLAEPASETPGRADEARDALSTHTAAAWG